MDVSPAHAHFLDRIRQFPPFDPHPQLSNRCCAACSLASMAGDNDLLIAVGAVMLAALSRRNWKKSKRALFLQGMLGGQTSAEHAEGPVVKMLQLAAEYREIRRGYFCESNRCGAVGPGEVVRDGPPLRPARDARQEGHVAVVLGGVGDEEGNANPALCPECSGHHRSACKVKAVSGSRVLSRPPTVPAKSPPDPSPYPSRQEDLPTNPGASSSVYSVDEAGTPTSIDASSSPHQAPAPAPRTQPLSSEEEAGGGGGGGAEGEEAPSICGESTIINLYRHSIFPPSPASSSSPPSSVHPPTNPGLPDQSTQPVASSKPRHSLAPIWIPRPYYSYGGGSGEEAEGQGDEEPAPVPSALWRRRTARFIHPHSPSGFGVGPGDAAAVAAAAKEEEGQVRGNDVVVVAGAKPDACWVPGVVAGRWI